MTTAAGKPLNRFNRTARLMAHYSMWFAAWLCIINVLSALAPEGWMQWALVGVSITTAFIPVMIAYYGDQVHIWAWDCPTCVARTPILNGEEEVARQRNRLRWVHDSRRVGLFALTALVVFLGAPRLIHGPWSQLCAIPWYGMWVYGCLAGETHRNLMPWCPWCRGRGGDDVPVDVVPPTPAGVKTDA